VVVDEIQRLPALLNEIHGLIEEQGLRFVLLGSSARKLRRAGVNLLGGRALQRDLSPLLPSETAPAATQTPPPVATPNSPT
jgi:predicted AAA+ superfamily ATPase